MATPIPTARRDPTSRATEARDALHAWAGAYPGWGLIGPVRDGFSLWLTACSAWGEYLTDLSRAAGPAALFEAQARLFAESMELCTQATARRLDAAGVKAPLLNDA